MQVKQLQVQIPVLEHATALNQVLREQVEGLLASGFLLQDHFYDMAWSGETMEATFRKRIDTPGGDPVLYTLVQAGPTEISYAFVTLDFGPYQEAVRSTLEGLQPGQVVTLGIPLSSAS